MLGCNFLGYHFFLHHLMKTFRRKTFQVERATNQSQYLMLGNKNIIPHWLPACKLCCLGWVQFGTQPSRGQGDKLGRPFGSWSALIRLYTNTITCISNVISQKKSKFCSRHVLQKQHIYEPAGDRKVPSLMFAESKSSLDCLIQKQLLSHEFPDFILVVSVEFGVSFSGFCFVAYLCVILCVCMYLSMCIRSSLCL